MPKGNKSELVHYGRLSGEVSDMPMVGGEDADRGGHYDQYVDDISGRPLITELVVRTPRYQSLNA